MSTEIISWIITGFIGLILLSSALCGMKRGLKKSLFRLIWLVATAVVLFFVTPLVSNAVNGIDLSGFNINVFGPVHKLSDVGVNVFSNFAGAETLENNPELLKFAQDISTVVLNVILFVLLFCVLRFLLWFIWAPIAHKNFDKHEIEQKKYKKEQNNKSKRSKGIETPKEEMPLLLSVKENKHRGWGALVGLVIGLVIIACTFMPIVGVNNIYQNVYANVLYEEDGEQEPYLNQFLDEDIRGYINTYEESLANKLLTYTGVSGISDYIFKNMATVKVGSEKLYFETLISKGVKIYGKAMVIMNFDTENITKESLSEVLSAVKSVFTEVKEIKAIYILADSIAPDMIKEYINSEKIKINDEQISNIVKNIVNDEDVDLTISNIQKQVELVINIAQEFNNKDLIVPFVDGEVSSVEDVAGLAFSIGNIDEFSNNVFDDNFNKIDILENEYPKLVDMLFSKVFDALEIAYTNQTTDGEAFSADKISSIKSGFKTLFTNALKFLSNYAKCVDLDFDAEVSSSLTEVSATQAKINTYDKTREAFNYLGNILNVVRVKPNNAAEEDENFLNETNYATLLTFLKSKATEATAGSIDLSCIINNFDNVDNWSEELNNFPLLYRAAIRLVNAKEEFDQLKQEEDMLLDDIGRGLGVAVDGSVLVNNQNLRTVFSNLLEDDNYVGSIKDILDIVVEDDRTVKTTILNNIYTATPIEYSNVGSDWENEIKCLKKILNADFSDIDLVVIGPVLDGASTSKIFTKTVLNAIIIDTIDTYSNDLFGYDEEHPMPNGSLKQAITRLKENIEDTSTNNNFSYETEFTYLQGLFDAIDNTYDADTINGINMTADEVKLVAIGTQFDVICGSSLILDSYICNNLLSYYLDDYITDLDDDIEVIINGIKSNLNNQVHYETEFCNLIYLTKVVQAEYVADTENGWSAEEVRLLALGDAFDKLCAMGDYADTETVASTIITKSVLNDLVCNFFDEYTNDLSSVDAGIVTILQKVTDDNHVSNLNNIVSYETEFEEILKLSKVAQNSSASLEEIGETLDSVTANSQIISSDIITELIDFYFNDETSSFGTEYENVINMIKNKVHTASGSYANILGELDETINEMENYEASIDSTNMESAGAFLDDVSAYSYVGDKEVAKEMSDIFIDKAKENYPSGEAAIDSILASHNYNSYVNDETPADYFATLYGEICNAIS